MKSHFIISWHHTLKNFLSNLFCVFVPYMYLLLWVCAHAHVCTYIWRPEVDVFPQSLFTFIFWDGISQWPWSYGFGWTWSSAIYSSWFPKALVIIICLTAFFSFFFLTWVLDIQTRVLMVSWKALYWLRHFPSPPFLINAEKWVIGF